MPRPLADAIHGKSVGGVVHFCFLRVSKSGIASGENASDG